ncbi:MAG: ECF-type sigma factor [Phycisphaerales bacterium]
MARGTFPLDESSRLVERLYEQLRPIAASALRYERPSHTLTPTALINEYFALCRLDSGTASDGARLEDIARAAGVAMRNILISHARARNTKKRGGGTERSVDSIEFVAYDDDGFAVRFPDLELLTSSIDRLRDSHPSLATVIELRFFGGFTVREIAERLRCSQRTIERHTSEALSRLASYS